MLTSSFALFVLLLRGHPHPSSMVMTLLLTTLLITLFIMSHAQPRPLQTTGLVWSEEFDGADGPLDASRWSYDTGYGNWGWGNGEVQEYTSSTDNVRVEGGSMVIDVRESLDNNGQRKFTSARVKTNGKVEFMYGSVEVKIKLPNLANGYWPAFWMLGSNFYTVGWPETGEIDIMEAGQADSIANGIVNRVVSSAAHWSHQGNYATFGQHVIKPNSFVNQWQVFRMDWTPDRISTFVDGTHIWTLDISGGCEGGGCREFHQPFFFIANVAVGGQFTGIMNANDVTASPDRMEIDYIKIYNNVLVDATMTIGGIYQAPPGGTDDEGVAPAAPSSPVAPAPTPAAASPSTIDCGVPQSCTGNVLSRFAGASTCIGHIEWLMTERSWDELHACDTIARKVYPTECGACDPGTGAPTIQYNFDCGNATMCTNDVLNSDAPSPVGHTCGERISHLIEVDGYPEEAACKTVAGFDYPSECGKCIHGVISCGKPDNSACHNVLDTLAEKHTCRERISWMVYDQGLTEREACHHVATDSVSKSVCSPCLP